ncbi:MAG: autotransporter domain-containing protein, partial [Phycisphaerales bacterium]
TDANSLWTNSGALYVGGDETHAAGTGSLILGEGTRVASNSIRIWNTGSLQGAGTVAADVVVDGTVRPGNSIGTLTIDGDVTFDPCSVLEVEISNAAADTLSVTGDVEIAGGTVRTIATETIVGSHQYAIVEANGVSGQFDALDTALLDSFVYLKAAELGYGPGSALLTVTSTPFDDPNVARTCNQASLGSVLQQTAEEGGNDVTTALQQLQTGGEVEAAYNQLSGQTTPSLAPVTVAGTTRHVGAIAGRLRNPAGGVSSAEGFDESSMAFAAGDTMSPDAGRYLFAAGNGTPVLGEKPWGVWGKGYGLYGDRESESGVPGYQYTVYGAAFGLDYRFTERLLLGFTGGYSQGDVDYSDSRDNSDVSATHAGVYGGYDTQHWYLDSILTYTALEYETRRFVDLLDERLEADPSGDMLTAYFEAGLNWRCGERTLIQPLAGLQLSTLKIDGFTETGGDGALTFDDQRYDSYKGSLGTRLTRQLFKRENGSRMELELRGRWVHEFGDTKASLDAGFASDPGATFRVSDGDIARDSAVLGAGLDTWFTRQTRLFVDYGTELNPDNTIQVVTAGLEHRW